MIARRIAFSFLISFFALSARAQEDDGYVLRLRWKPVEGIASYSLQVGASEDFAQPYVDTRVDGPEFEWEPDLRTLRPGQTVYFRIASIDARGEVGAFSEPRKLALPDLDEEGRARLKTAQEQRIRTRFTWERDFSLRVGPTQFAQSSQELDLKGAALAIPYLAYGLASSSKLRFARMLGATVLSEGVWRLELALRANPFRALAVPRAFEQPSAWAFEASASALKESRSILSGGRLAWGLAARLDFRFVKAGSESVVPRQGFSLGPAVSWERESSANPSPWVPRGLSAGASLPALGLFVGGPAGVEATGAADWPFWSGGIRKISLQIGAQSALTYWPVPATTFLWSWGFWVAPRLIGFL